MAKTRTVEPARIGLPAKKPKRAKKPKPHAVFIANDCYMLCVDPGSNSGWAIYHRGMLQMFGECSPYGDEPMKLLKEVAGMGTAVLVLERPFSVRFGNQTSIGAADKVWRVRAQECGYAKRVVRVFPARWRAKVLGPPWHMAKRKAVREHEQKVARALVAKDFAGIPGDDACPAILIGVYAAHAGEVAAVLPKPRKRAA